MVKPQPPAKGILDFLMKLDGGEPRLIVAEKALSASDVKQKLSRFIIPSNKVRSKEEYLRNEEITILEESSKGVPAIFVDPDYKTYRVSLKQWKKNMVLYPWKTVLEGYRFAEGEKFQLWSFRRQQTLHFALVPKDEDYGYLDVFSHLDDDCFCLDDFSQLDLFHSTAEEYVNVSALPDLGSFEDTDVVASYYDDA